MGGRLLGCFLLVAAAGCASPATLQLLQTEVGTLRSEMSDLRWSQELASRDMARALSELKSLDARALELQASQRLATAELSRLTGRIDEADAAIRRTRAIVESASTGPTPGRPREPAPRAGTPEQIYAAALATLQSHEHGQAVLDFLDFLAKHPRHRLASNAQYWIGEAYYAQRDYRQALVEFEKVLELSATGTKAPDALLKIGLCYTNLRDGTRAQRTWQRVVREYPKSEAAVRARALLRVPRAAARP